MNQEIIKAIIKNNPVLSHKEQLELVVDWQNHKNKQSLDKLVLSNVRLVAREAHSLSFKNKGSSYDDLLQEGFEGLLKAADMFDPEMGTKFTTYAMLWVKANLRAHVRDTRSAVRLGKTRDERKLFSNLHKAKTEAEEAGLTGHLVYQYVAKKIGVSEEAVIKMNTVLMQNDKSMDDIVSNKGQFKSANVTRFGETLPDPMCSEGQLSNGADKSSKLELISKVVDSLPEVERKIIRDRYLCDDPKTLRELQSEMSISREWIRKLEIRALDRVKKRLNSEYGITDILDI